MAKRIVSFLLFVVMMANLVAPLVGRLSGKDVCELTELGNDETEKEGKTVKEIEKEAFGFFAENHFEFFNAGFIEEGLKPLLPKDDCAISELFADSPERPPEA